MQPTTTPKPARGRMKSLLGYYGGKAGPVGAWIAQDFVNKIPHLNYVEPYGGMGGVLMQKRPSRTEVWNDKAEVLLNLFDVIRDPVQCEELRLALVLTLFSRKEYARCCKKQFAAGLSPVERARCTYVALAQSRNNGLVDGGWRHGGAVYDGAVADTFIRGQDRIPEVATRLRSVQMECGEALNIIGQWDHRDTLLYIDSPYLAETRNGGRNYQHEMGGEQDHLELLTLLRSCQSKVLVSGYASSLYARELEAHDWQRYEMETVARSSAQRQGTNGKSKRVECLWANERAQRHQLSLF